MELINKKIKKLLSPTYCELECGHTVEIEENVIYSSVTCMECLKVNYPKVYEHMKDPAYVKAFNSRIELETWKVTIDEQYKTQKENVDKQNAQFGRSATNKKCLCEHFKEYHWDISTEKTSFCLGEDSCICPEFTDDNLKYLEKIHIRKAYWKNKEK